ncbi:COG0637 Predicted phosphatase/phosphohexomutase [Candidatus Nanopelagicaceae bacterium]
MSNIKAVLFDMDGVLIDAREWHYEALNEVLRIFGYEITRAMHEDRFDGLSTSKKLEMLTKEVGLPQHIHGMINRIKQDRTLRIAASKCFPNIAHQVLISKLKKQGFKVGVVTNSIRQTTEFMLTYAGLFELLDVVVTNQDIDKPKPNPDGYQFAMQKLDVLPSETLIVEDSPYGVAAGKASGAKVVQVNSVTDVSIDLFYDLIPEIF